MGYGKLIRKEKVAEQKNSGENRGWVLVLSRYIIRLVPGGL